MEFSYHVTEADYMNAVKVRFGRFTGSRAARSVMFWVFILVCLLLLWAVVSRNAADAPAEPAPARTSPPHAVLVNILPFVLIAGVWVLILVRMGPRTLRRLYRKDPAMQGTYTVTVTPDGLSLTNTAGISAQTRWNIYESWRESKGVVVLIHHSNAYFVLAVSGLTDSERIELRGLLAAAIPRS